MFKFDFGTFLDENVFIWSNRHPYNDRGSGNVVYTNPNISRMEDGTWYYLEGSSFLDEEAKKSIEENWGWLKVNPDGTLPEKFFLEVYKGKYGKIYFCEPIIVEAIKKMGIRDQYPNWSVPGSEELEVWLKAYFEEDYIAEEGKLML